MEYIYEMSALRIYSKIARKNYSDMAELVGISPTTMSRYVKGERLPDIETLVRISNMLRISIGYFIHHPDVEFSTVEICLEEEWKPIKFNTQYLEIKRVEKGVSKKDFINEIRDITGVKTSISTYNKLISGEGSGIEFVLAYLQANQVALDVLFQDEQLKWLDMQNDSASVVISRKTLLDFRSRIKQLEEDNRRLYAENKRYLRREQARVYTPGEPQDKADKRMLKFIKKIEQELAELKSYLPNDCTIQLKEINEYKNQESKSRIAAEDNFPEYGNRQE